MGSEGGERTFTVSVAKKEVVAAVLPLQEHWLPLSNLDLLLPPVDVGVFFCYRNPLISMNFGSMVGSLKKALAQVLVSYYAFAGEVVANSAGEPEILHYKKNGILRPTNRNRGVDFYEAFADIELQHLNLYNPDQSIEAKLVPKKEDEMAQSKAISDSVVPSFRRSLLNPRRPACIHPSLDDMYVPISKLQPPKDSDSDDDHLISRIYYVKADSLNKLQSLASSIGCQRTKLESFSALLWQLVAKSAQNGMAKVSKMGIVVDGRTRLGDTMDSYFGNVLSIPYGKKKIDELIANPLSWVANEVHDFLESAATKEHFLGLIDWVEAHRPEPALAKIYGSGSDDGPAFVVSSGQRFPVSKVDFGWGAPFFGSYHFPWGGNAGYVMPMPSPLCNGDWIVYMHLLKTQIHLIEAESSNLFQPLTCVYLKN
ncbi:hypothetical protein JCGZ_22558 [Jatropha curcas]|uniref:Uncharacterized protein n=1 Tax=Jatropha curcas TaxID=180498 RepID=A0A067JQB0_JATCU|nr:hypothetical protein JCGZ_22558 [Jatropha curcas]